jgi:hypothetical protein
MALFILVCAQQTHWRCGAGGESAHMPWTPPINAVTIAPLSLSLALVFRKTRPWAELRLDRYALGGVMIDHGRQPILQGVPNLESNRTISLEDGLGG